MALAAKTEREVPFNFNRKEAKDHGEGGLTVGAELRGRVVIVDDVITAGISIDESVNIIRSAGAVPVAVCIALDRQERGHQGEESAAAMVAARHDIPVLSIASLQTLIGFLNDSTSHRSHLAAIRDYQDRYGFV